MTVLGLDGCKSGWVVVVADDSGYVDIFVARDISHAANVGLHTYAATTMVVDMPIGLADSRPRRADAGARDRIGARRSSVFDVPIRAALEARTREEANSISRDINGTGVGSMSYALRDKILEVDEFARSATLTLREGHPEVSFAELAGRHLQFYKKTLPGALERRELLMSVNLAPPMESEITLRKVGFDDIHDAAVMAWTALRVERGDARSVPSEPETFSDGWQSAIWF